MPKYLMFQLELKKDFKKGQDFVDFFIFFIIILMALYFVYLFIFSTLEIKIQYSNFYKALSLAIQASEELFISHALQSKNFVHIGFFDESKILEEKENFKHFQNIFYTFSQPQVDFKTNNQLCVKRSLYLNSTNTKKDFWTCYWWN
ncbi:MAG: hypothetical protein N3D10_00190 [Candidatus Micrarchaeota archaeon]|nr:hypothetical protein [Candidatus Micrarchaeota archaeon]